jgi:hypothetical protein
MLRLVVLPALIALLTGCGHATSPPTDEALIAIFHEHRARLDELRQMICADQYQKVSLEFSYPATIPTDRLGEYRDMLRSVGAENISLTENCGAEIFVWGYGRAGNADYKGYAFSSTTPQGIAHNLDTLVIPHYVTQVHHRTIDGNWYLYFRQIEQ